MEAKVHWACSVCGKTGFIAHDSDIDPNYTMCKKCWSIQGSIENLIEQKRIWAGMTRAQLVAVLDEPHHKSTTTKSMREPLIWKYGDVEFHWLPKSDALWLVIAAEDATHHTTLLIDKTA